MAKNRLEIILAAKAEGLRRGLRDAENEAKKAASQIAKAFADSGDGAEILGDSIAEVSKAFRESETKGLEALKRLSDGSSDAGQKIRKSFDGSGKSVDEVEKEVEQLVKAIGDFESAGRDVDKLKNSFDQLEKQIDDTSDATDKLSSIQIAEKLAQDIGAVTERFRQAGEKARDLRRDIKLAFADPKDQEKYIKAAEKLRDKYGELIDTADFGKAIKRLDNLGSASEENLTRISKLALDAGRDLEDAADDLAEFLAPLDSGNADFALLDETLRANFGIAAKALKEYGAEVDSNGKLVARTRDQQEKAQKALKAYIDESSRYANIAGRSKDAQDKVTDSVEKFNREVGDQVTEFKNAIAEGILPYIDGINGWSDSTKAAIGITAEITGAVASFGVKAVELGAYMSILGPNVLKAAKAIKAMDRALLAARASSLLTAGAIGVGVVAIAAIVKSYNDMEQATQDAEAAERKLANTRATILNDDRAKYVQKSVDAIVKETEAIEDSGRRRAAIQDAILAKEEAARLYRDRGFNDRAGQLEAETKLLKSQRNVYDTDAAAVAKAEAEKTEARKRAYEQSAEAFREFKLELQRGEFESSKAALTALQSISTGLDGDALKEANAEKKKLQKDALAEQLDILKEEVEARRLSVDDAKVQYDRLVKQYEARGSQLRVVEKDFTAFTKAQLDERLQAELNLEAQLLQLKQESIAAEVAAGNPALDSLRKRLAAGEDVESQIKREIDKEAESLKILIDKEAAIKRIVVAREREAAIREDGGNAAKIAEIAAEKENQLNKQVAAQKAAIDRKTADDREKIDRDSAKKSAAIQAELTTLSLERFRLEQKAADEAFEDRRKQLDEEERLGQDVGQRRIDLEREIADATKERLQDQLKLEIEVIEARNAAANQGASKDQQKINNAKAELDIIKAKQQTQEDTNKLNDTDLAKAREKTLEIQKQIDAQKDLNKEVQKGFNIASSFGDVTQGLEGLGGGFGEGFGTSSQKAPKEQKAPSESELRDQLTRAKIEEAEAAEKARGKQPRGGGDPNPVQQVSRGEAGQSAAQAFSQTPADSASVANAQVSQQSLSVQQQLLAAQQQNNQSLQKLVSLLAQRQQNPATNAGADFSRGSTRLPGQI